jgi:tetratricopeptide (TPR) repeat protein
MIGSNKIRSSVLLLSILAWLLAAHPNVSAQASGSLPAPRANLLPLHWPDLKNLEPAARAQLESLQNELAATAKKPGITEAALSDAYGQLGRNYQAYSLNAAARECYLNASRLSPEDFRWVYLMARLDQQEDRLDEAIRRYQIARRLNPEYVAVPVSLGNIYLQLNRLEEASENFNAASAIAGSSAAALYGLGQVALSQRKFPDAVRYLEAALAAAPGANRIHYSLAMAYRNLGDTDKALAHLRQQGPVGVRVVDPLIDGLEELIKGERIHLARGKVAMDSGRYAEAVDQFRLAIAANRDSLAGHINLGGALTQTGDLKGAAEHFAEAVRIDPRNTNAHFNLAILLAKENQHVESVRHLQEVVSIEPADLSARFFLAQELLRSERRAEALVEFARVSETDPNNEEALLQLVTLLQEQRQFKQALEKLNQAHTNYPQKERTAVMLSYLLAASPQFDLRNGARALELAQAIYRAQPSAEHGALLAMALAELGRCTEAAEWQRRAIAAAEHENKTDLLAQLKSDLRLYEKGKSCRPPG